MTLEEDDIDVAEFAYLAARNVFIEYLEQGFSKKVAWEQAYQAFRKYAVLIQSHERLENAERLLVRSLGGKG